MTLYPSFPFTQYTQTSECNDRSKNSVSKFVIQITINTLQNITALYDIICKFVITGLYRLAINNNPLETIHEEAFYGLDNTLWELELKYDKLTAVPSRSLRYLQKLRLLDLTGMFFNSSKHKCVGVFWTIML